MITTTHTQPQQAICLYTPKQIYEIEKNWFEHNDSFGLMQQAAWQLAYIIKHGCDHHYLAQGTKSVLVVAGAGNNGGDAWLIAHYLRQLTPNWSITVLQVAEPSTNDSQKAKQAYKANCQKFCKYLTLETFLQPISEQGLTYHFDIIIDGIFGIGLDRQPMGDYQKMIAWVNEYRQQALCQVISIDVPSGLNATTGEVYNGMAIHADITLCVIARKVGLHLANSKDYVGQIIDIPLLPIGDSKVYLHTQLPTIPKRQQVSHKGSYGHVLIIGGNRLDNGHGMAGAAILAASAAFASGAGKVTVACHRDFHPAIITALPNAMTADLHQIDSIIELIKSVDVVAIGMGLGRDNTSFNLFKPYVDAIIAASKWCVIDADGLYHLANWQTTPQKNVNAQDNTIFGQSHSQVYLTPHSAEAGRLLNKPYTHVDQDKPTAIRALAEQYGGNWLIKGAQTIVFERDGIDICGLGNAGMATAGMGDCLAGLVASLLAQGIKNPMLTAVLIHAKAGDDLAQQVGEYALQANQMATAIGAVIHHITDH